MSLPPPTPRRSIAAAGTPGDGAKALQGAVLVVAVLYFARELLIPLVLAVLLSFVLAPLVRALRRIHVPRAAAVLVAVVIGFALILGIGTLMARQATSLAANLPTYQATIAAKLEGLRGADGLFTRLNEVVRQFGRGEQPGAPPLAGPPGDHPAVPQPAPRPANQPGTLAQAVGAPPVQVEIHDPAPTSLELLKRVAEPLLGPLATTGIVVILVIFILLYREDLRDRLIRLAGARDLHRTMAAMDDAAYRLSRFFLVQTGTNAAFGLFISLALWAIGIPNPFLWGTVAGLMRFVPFIGVFIAVAFPILLALAVDPGWTTLIWVLVLFGISEMLMGQVVEPLIYGHSTGLSPIAVIGAATFWTWLWGPIGLLLSVPLTVCLVVLGRHVERLEFLEVMLGDAPPLDPEETFYQRALAGDEDALAEQAERYLKDQPLVEYLDAVALPALRLAQADALHGVLGPERLETLERSVLALLEDLEEEEDAKPPATEAGDDPAPPAAWQAPGAVLCLPGRGSLDPLMAAMLGQALVRRGFGVKVGNGPGEPGAEPPQLLCLCLLEGGSSTATARYLLRRARRRLPDVPALALAWGTEPEGALDRALRAEGEAKPLLRAASLAEAIDLAAENAGSAFLAAPAAAPAAEQSRSEPPLDAVPA